MKRESIMTTYKNLIQMNKSWNAIKNNATAPVVQKEIIEYAEKHGKKQAYLYNNRLFFGIINRNTTHKEQYDANWRYINSLNQ